MIKSLLTTRKKDVQEQKPVKTSDELLSMAQEIKAKLVDLQTEAERIGYSLYVGRGYEDKYYQLSLHKRETIHV